MIQRVADLIGAVLGTRALEPAANLFVIRAAWSEVLGERLGARARPLRLERGELLVSVPDAVWRQEMSFLTSEIASWLNRALGDRAQIEHIRLIGNVDLPDEPPPPRARRLSPYDISSSASEGGMEERRDAPAQSDSTNELPSDIAAALAALEQARVSRLRRDRAAHASSVRPPRSASPPALRR